MSNRKSTLSKKDLLKVDPRHLEAVHLRTLGWTLQEIGKQLGVGAPTVSRWIKEAHDTYLSQMDESMDIMIRFQERQLDWGIKKITTSIEESQYGEGLARKLEVLVKLMDRRAALRGLDAPKKTQNVNVGVNFSNLSLEELRAEAEKLGIKTQPLPIFNSTLPGETPLLPPPMTVESIPEG